MRYQNAGLVPAFVVPGPFCDHAAMATSYRAILSPCTGVCTIDADGLCAGCVRTLDEIARWSTMGDGERQRLMEDVLPSREAARARD